MNIREIPAVQPGGAANILNGTGSPTGVVSATGPAVYYDNTTPTAPVMWIKSTSGTSSTDWVIVGTFQN